MGLPCRFISASAGTVTFVVGMPVEAELDPPGKLVTLMVVSSAAPETQDATRTIVSIRPNAVRKATPPSHFSFVPSRAAGWDRILATPHRVPSWKRDRPQ